MFSNKFSKLVPTETLDGVFPKLLLGSEFVGGYEPFDKTNIISLGFIIIFYL